MNFKISQNGIDLIKKYESLRLHAYYCPANVLTIGYGHTGKDVYSGMVITEKMADDLLLEDLKEREDSVNRLVKSKINQNQFDALVSFCYNLGEGNLSRSTLLKRVNYEPDNKLIAYEFSKWIRANGNILPGLVRRRKEESDLYFKKYETTIN